MKIVILNSNYNTNYTYSMFYTDLISYGGVVIRHTVTTDLCIGIPVVPFIYYIPVWKCEDSVHILSLAPIFREPAISSSTFLHYYEPSCCYTLRSRCSFCSTNTACAIGTPAIALYRKPGHHATISSRISMKFEISIACSLLTKYHYFHLHCGN
jgi:hypothetical protein